jgi:hypothetical protein
MAMKRKNTVDLDDAIRSAKEVTFDHALTAARRWYYGEVRSMGDEILSEIRDGSIRSEEVMRDTVVRATDCQITIYTAQSEMALAASDHADAYQENYGDKPESVEVAAAAALEYDIGEYLNAHSDEWPWND